MKNSHLSLLGHTRHTRHAGYASTNPRSTAAPTDLSGTLELEGMHPGKIAVPPRGNLPFR